MRCGKTPGTERKKSRITVRREGRINACFFTTLPIWDTTAGYFASKRDTPAMHIRILPVVTSRRIYHASFFQGIMGHRYSVSSVFLFSAGNAPTFRHYKFVPWPCLTRAPHAAVIHGARHKTFLAWFLP